MKKLFLSLLIVAGLSAQTASDAGQLFLDETNKDLQEELLGAKLVTLCGYKQMAQLVKEATSAQELEQLKAQLGLFVRLLELSNNPEFMTQFEAYQQIDRYFQEHPITTKAEQEAFVKKVVEECPLVIESLELSDQLKFFQAGLLKGLLPALETLLKELQA